MLKESQNNFTANKTWEEIYFFPFHLMRRNRWSTNRMHYQTALGGGWLFADDWCYNKWNIYHGIPYRWNNNKSNNCDAYI